MTQEDFAHAPARLKRQGTISLLIIAGAIGVFYWFFDGIVDHYVFVEGTLYETVFDPGAMETWMRATVMLCIMGLGFYALALVKARRRIEAGLEMVAAGTASAVHNEFHRQLVEHLARALDCCCAFVTEVVDLESGRMRIVSIWLKDAHADAFEYDIKDTPCESVFDKGVCSYPKDVARLFPKDSWLADNRIEGYLAIPLKGSDGTVYGHLGVMSARPLKRVAEKEAFLRLFADRALAEAERLRAQKRLNDSEELYRMTLSAISDSVFITDDNGRFTYAHHDVFDRFGRPEMSVGTGATVEGLLGRRIWEEAGRIRLVGETRKIDHAAVDNAGLKRAFLITIKRVNIREGTLLFVCHDITERKRTEAALSEKTMLLENILRSSLNLSIAATDQNFRIMYYNKVAEELFGYKAEDALGRTVMDIHASEQVPIERFEEQMKIVRRDGTHTYVFDRKYRDKAETKRIEARISLLTDSFGKHAGYLHMAQDITDKKRMEDELLKAQKLESLSVLAAGVAHDFNNLLAAVVGNLSYCRHVLEKGHKAVEPLEKAEKACISAKSLSRHLLTFSRGCEPVKQTIDVARLARESMEFSLSGSNVASTFSAQADLWHVDADPSQISQVINNVTINAREAMPNGGRLDVSVENAVVKHGATLPLDPGQYVLFRFKDDGPGIPKENLQKIFDPFFTTKKLGSGLGLSIAYSVAKKHGGIIEAASGAEKGSVFSLYLPAVAEKKSAPKAPRELLIQGMGSVLVMDDEENIREAVGYILKHLGYSVELASTGDEAVDAYSRAIADGRRFDAAILDMTVHGGMGGLEALKEVLKIDPEAKVILSSGYSAEELDGGLNEAGHKGFIDKPYTMAQLSSVLHDVIKARAAGRD